MSELYIVFDHPNEAQTCREMIAAFCENLTLISGATFRKSVSTTEKLDRVEDESVRQWILGSLAFLGEESCFYHAIRSDELKLKHLMFMKRIDGEAQFFLFSSNLKVTRDKENELNEKTDPSGAYPNTANLNKAHLNITHPTEVICAKTFFLLRDQDLNEADRHKLKCLGRFYLYPQSASKNACSTKFYRVFLRLSFLGAH